MAARRQTRAGKPLAANVTALLNGAAGLTRTKTCQAPLQPGTPAVTLCADQI
jgi:hypothetical protein